MPEYHGMLGGRFLFKRKGGVTTSTGEVLALVNGSSPGSGHWLNEALPAGTQGLDAVSCPTTSRCWAVGAEPSSLQSNVKVKTKSLVEY